MNFEVRNYSLVFFDALYSMTVGFVRGIVGGVVSAFAGKNRTALFFKDFFVGILFSLLLFSYCVSFANYKILRWYNCLFALFGYLLCPDFIKRGAKYVADLLRLVLRKIAGMVKKRLFDTLKRLKSTISIQKKQKITQKSNEVVLSEGDMLLYN